MKKIIKLSGIIAASFILLILIAIISLNIFIRSDAFKNMVAERITKTLNIPVEMGSLSTNVFSGVHIKNLNIKNPPDFPEGYSLKTDEIILKYNLYHLLRRNLKIEEIKIIRPDINLLQKEDGTFNLALASSKPDTKPKQNVMMAPFIAEDAQIIDGNFTWRKAKGNAVFSIRNFTIKTKINSINSFPDMNLNLSAGEIESPMTSPITDFKANLKASKGQLRTDDLSLNISKGVVAMKGNSTLPSENKSAEYNATISVKDIDLETLVMQFMPESKNLLKGLLNADIDIKGLGFDAKADMKVNIPSFLVQDKIKIGQFKGNISYSDFDFTISDVTMNVFGGYVEGNGTGTLSNIINPEFNTTFNINNIDASSVLDVWVQDSSLIKGKISGNINAFGNMSNIKSRGKISSDKLNINQMGNLTDITAPFQATVTKQNKEINFENLSAKIYGGSINGNANIILGKDSQPNFSTTLSLSAVDAKDALKQLTGQTFLTGKAEGMMKLAGKGNNIKAVTGNADISLKNGKISSHPIQNVLSLIPQMPDLRTINFETATVSSTIKDGKVNIKNAQLEDPKLIKFSSKGEIKLSGQKLSLPSHLSLKCSDIIKMQLLSGAFTQENNIWCGIDFKIFGTLSKPKTDLQDKLAKQAITGILEQLLDK